MINETFDKTTEAVISPENAYGKRDTLCDICIITFSYVVLQNILNEFDCEVIAEIACANGNIPIYRLEYKGRKIAVYLTMISSAGAGTCLEEARCLTGASKFIMFGSCGCLSREIAAGKVIVPTAAYRDEGFSYHYAPAADYIAIKNAEKVAAFLEKSDIPYVMGKTWTTDGLYRETRGNMEKRKSEGCIAVEMECAGMQAVCDFRGLEYYDFLISGDLLDTEEWDRRILGLDGERSHQLRSFYIALELALTV